MSSSAHPGIELAGIELSPTQAEDCPELVRMHLAAHREAYGHLFSEEFFTAREAQLPGRMVTQRKIIEETAHSGGQHWIARDAEGIVGFAHSAPARPVEGVPTPHPEELQGLYSLARVYGRGVGQALVAAALADRAAYLWVLRDNPRAQAFYRKLGFQENGVGKELPPEWNSLFEIQMVRG
ncbi:GNAT family N-acetyltransferase [Acaricomes phytoseiuli]|uniref:GNAT family N-acetyltransferase n=1 Tax=Acaricomes phytoseiuli TaxID=291968 RepID=UPI00036255F5|nr:GNAT family N-acetyltransferase [Acaricomes phytoseiuli]MCW1250571.1 GNAT family N-acetyltransferase [Acaricomes phytoseiuli]